MNHGLYFYGEDTELKYVSMYRSVTPLWFWAEPIPIHSNDCSRDPRVSTIQPLEDTSRVTFDKKKASSQ